MTAVQPAPVADRTDDEPRVQRLATIVGRYCYAGGINGPEIAAVRVLADEEIRAGLHAATVLARLDAAHQWRSWGANSTSRSCTCGAPGCTVRDELDADP